MTAQLAETLRHEHTYERGGRVIAAMSNDVFGITVSPAQQEVWNTCFPAMYYLDRTLDQELPSTERLQEFHHHLAFIQTGLQTHDMPPDLHDALARYRSALISRDSEVPADAVTTARTIALLGERLRQTSSVRSLGKIAMAEGRATSKLITLPHPSTPAEASFNSFLIKLGAVGNTIDSLFDLSSDRAAGLLNFAPTIHDRLELSRQLIVPATQLLGSIGIKTMLQMVKMAHLTYTDRKK